MIAPTEIPGARVRDKYPYLGYVRRWDELVGTIVEVVQ